MNPKKSPHQNRQPSDPMCTDISGENFFSSLFASIGKEPYGMTAIDRQAAKKLAARLMNEADGPTDLADSLRAYFALDAKSLEAVLAESRQLAPTLFPSGDKMPSTLGSETDVAAAISDLNNYCMDQYKIPFHRATLLREAKSLDASEPCTRLAKLVLTASRTLDCAEEVYPRYVGCMWPWKLQFSWSQSFRQRKGDSGCNVHMQYGKKLRAWVGLAPVVYVIVAANQWGMALAANDNALFIKSWTLAPVGFLPPALIPVLPTRKY